jgi:hypothetical protein
VIAGTSKGEVVAMDANGKVVWTSSIAGEVIAPAAVSRKTAGHPHFRRTHLRFQPRRRQAQVGVPARLALAAAA